MSNIGSGVRVVVCVFSFCTVSNVRLDMVCYWVLNLGEFNVYWTVHHCNSCRMKDQIDVTCYFISLLMY